MEKKKKILRTLCTCVLVALLYICTGIQSVYAAPQLEEIKEEDYYGRYALSKMDNADDLLYVYDKLDEGIDEFSTSINLSDEGYEISSNELRLVFFTYLNDYPQKFWTNTGYSYSIRGSEIVSISPNYCLTKEEAKAQMSKFEEEVNKIIEGIDGSMSEFERELIIHDRLVDKITYSADTSGKYVHSAYGALVKNDAVCDGYARAFQYALYKVGIHSTVVTGTASGSHAWNLVKIDGKYYYADLTWDDPIGNTSGDIKHSYMNLPLSEMDDDHTLTMDIELPECNSWDANYFNVHGTLVEDITIESISNALRKDLREEIYIINSRDDFWDWFQQNCRTISSNVNILGGFSYGYIPAGKSMVIYFTNCTREPNPVTGVKADKENQQLAKIGDKFTIGATVTPSDAYNQVVRYSSSNTDVAIVDKYTGMVTAVGYGVANIIVTTEDGGLTDSCTVLVGEELKATVSLNDSNDATEFTVGDTINIKVNATGGTNEYKYTFKINGVVCAEETMENTYVWTTTDKLGVNNIEVVISDGYSVANISKEINIKVKPVIKPIITLKAGNGEIAVSWKAVEGATKYQVCTYVNGKYSVVANNYIGTSYVINKLTNGTKYGVLVRAYINGKWTTYSTEDLVYATPNGPIKPVVSVLAGNRQVKVSWVKLAGATKYQVCSYVGGKYTVQINNYSGTSYVVSGLTNNTEYGFLVRAYVSGKWTTYSKEDLVYATPEGKPVVKAVAGDSQISVSWEAVEGATRYQVCSYIGGKYTLQVNNYTETNYVIKGLVNGKKYGVLVRAYINGKWTTYSTADLVYATPVINIKPIVTVVTGDKQVSVSWNAVEGATRYQVCSYVNGKYTLQINNFSGNNYTVTGLENGTEYGFLVRAYVNGVWTTYSTADLVYATPNA